MLSKTTLRFGVLGIAVLALALPAMAQAPELGMLDTLTRGNWELRIRGEGNNRKICLRTGREFIQLQHRQSGCTQYVVQDDPSEVTVQYTCRGDGYGRTSIRRESSGLVQIRSQGTQARTPFTIEGEARRIGPC